jgi:short subunit dehydrogenase-like uncharacterized protein
MNRAAEFDLIVFGATGYTGRLVAEYLASRYGRDPSLNWALAGRDAGKLGAIRNSIGMTSSLPLVIADVSDSSSLRAMVSRTKLVLTTVGPYQLYGSELVAACARTGVDYVDLCGEPAWMRAMIDAHEAAAKASGSRIVFSCGFDSVPFELGVWFLQQTAKTRLGAMVPRVKARVRRMKGSFSGGTAASLKANITAAIRDRAVFELLKNPFSLTPGFAGPEQPSGEKPAYDEDLGSWTAPFLMSGINTRNVHRSNFLMGHPYGKDFVYDEMVLAGPGESGEALSKAMARNQTALASGAGPKPGQGPTKEEREAGFYDVLFVGFSDDGKQVRASVSGDKDPGYGSTSKIVSEAAICLARDAAEVAGGIWTPGAAMK